MIVKKYDIVKNFNYDLLDIEILNSNSVQEYSGFTGGDNFLEIYGSAIVDELSLDSIVNNHIPISTPVYKLTGILNDPRNLDYDIYGLHKKKTIVRGELVLIEYYKNYNGIIYSDLVVKEERTYTRNEYGLVLYRDQISSWYLTDGTIGCVKPYLKDENDEIIPLRKYYNPQEQMEEAEQRRSNLLADAKLYTASQVGLPNALDLMKSVSSEISLYIQGEQDSLLNAISVSDKPYLTQEIKDTLILILTLND